MSWVAAAVAGGTVVQSMTANKAADAQTSATNSAIGEERRQFDLNRRDLAPYRDAGRQAIGRLSEMMGLGAQERDPRYQQIFDRMVAERDQNHKNIYGFSIFDPNAGWAEGIPDFEKDRLAEAAGREFQTQYPDAQLGGGELTKKFTEQDFRDDPVVKLGLESGLNEGTQAIDRMMGARGMRNSGAALKGLTRFATDYTGQKAGDSYNRFYADQDRTFNRLSGIAGSGQTAATNTAAMGSQSTGRVGDLMTAGGNARGAAAISQGNAFNQGLNTVGNWWNQNQMLDKLTSSRVPGYGGGFGGFGGSSPY